MNDAAPLLQVDDLHVAFRTPLGLTEAVKGVSFQIEKGETMALVGESRSRSCSSSTIRWRAIPRAASGSAARS
jgi:ABC-type microcin C transport system duplicated ATPase subunit YejF